MRVSVVVDIVGVEVMFILAVDAKSSVAVAVVDVVGSLKETSISWISSRSVL